MFCGGRNKQQEMQTYGKAMLNVFRAFLIIPAHVHVRCSDRCCPPSTSTTFINRIVSNFLVTFLHLFQTFVKHLVTVCCMGFSTSVCFESNLEFIFLANRFS